MPFKKLGKIAPQLWYDHVTITGTKPVKHGAITNNETVMIIENEPAKVILKSQQSSRQTFFNTDEYDAELLIRTGINIPAGAKITVTDVNGQITKYKRASKGYTGYVSHQEVAMVRDEKA